MKRKTVYLIAILGCLIFSSGAAELTSRELPGLSVHQGQVLLNGTPYRGIGANYFSLFSRTLKNSADRSYDEGLKKLAEAQIPFVRFMACAFWPVDWELYLENRDEYFKRLDGVVAAAERYQVGLIPSLFWNMSSIPDLLGEPMDQLGNPSSKTLTFIQQYTEEIVLRYRHSPAIWGWEFGNEYNLHADLPNASKQRPKIVPKLKTALKRTSRDELSSEAMLTAFGHFARAVRQHDSQRILITGNSIPRPSAYHNTKEKSWTKDTPAQFEQILLRDNPDPFNALSIHVYRNEGQGNTESITELLTLSQEISKRVGKPLLVGEFGAPKTLGPDKEKTQFREILNAIESTMVPLSAFWVFDHSGQNADWNVNFDNQRNYMLQHVAAANQRLAGISSQ
jgi:hypothetical protein